MHENSLGTMSLPTVNISELNTSTSSSTWVYPYGWQPYPYATPIQIPTYTPPLPEHYRLAIEVLGAKGCTPSLKRKAEAILSKALG